MEKLKKICQKVHKFIEINKADISHDLYMRDFPKGACGNTSYILGRILLRNGYKNICYIHNNWSEYLNSSHAWLMVDGIVCDITADQFNDYERNFNRPAVYVGMIDDFYSKLNIGSESCSMREVKTGPFDGADFDKIIEQIQQLLSVEKE